MKRLQLICLATVIFMNSLAQNNPELNKCIWFKVKTERKDGSSIIDYNDSGNSIGMYIFGKDSFRIVENLNETFKLDGKYTVEENQLIMNNAHYLIEKLNTERLVFSEVSPETQEDELNRYYLVSSEFYLDSLVKNNAIILEKDTLIADYRYFPFFQKGSICDLIMNKLNRPNINGNLIGSFIITPLNQVNNIIIKKNEGIKEKHIEKIKVILKESSEYWINPVKSNFYTKINFVLEFKTIYAGKSMIYARGFRIGEEPKKKEGLTTKEQIKSKELFEEGLVKASKYMYDQAIESFTNCIKIDTINIFAYYNRAYCYLKMNNVEKACLDWHYLSKLNQIKAKEYYNQNCQK